MTAAIQVLWIGPEPPGREIGLVLQNDRRFVTTTVSSYAQLKGFAMNRECRVAVLAPARRKGESVELARLIRRQWPGVQILVVSEETPFTDDALYDDRVEPGSPVELFADAVERLARRREETGQAD